MNDHDHAEANAPSPEVVARLVASHREFLSFLERRVPSRAIAEEILQSAYVRTLERGASISESESAVAWFYRLLRNSIVDHYRRRAAESKALAREANEPEIPTETELKTVVCACLELLIPNLKPEYAEVLRRVDLEERPVVDVAADLQITPNNASVRLHRARQGLKRQLELSCGTCATHGCLDCRCGGPKQPPS